MVSDTESSSIKMPWGSYSNIEQKKYSPSLFFFIHCLNFNKKRSVIDSLFPRQLPIMFWGYEKKNQIHEPFLKLFPIDILSITTYLDALIFMFDKNDFELVVLPTIQFLELF